MKALTTFSLLHQAVRTRQLRWWIGLKHHGVAH
jgi:hypothetical protein